MWLCVIWLKDWKFFYLGYTRSFASAAEPVSADDDEDEELVDVGDEADTDETAVTDEGGEEEEDTGSRTGGSPNADTTILFIKPSAPTGSTLGMLVLKISCFYQHIHHLIYLYLCP